MGAGVGGAASGPSLRGRIALAVALTVSFYALALTVALALIAAPVILFASTGHANLFLTIGSIAAGLAVLRAIVPARDRFAAPGPGLGRDRHPRLRAVLEDLERDTGEPVPDDVYLALDVNASVSEASTGLLSGHRRVMTLGLPLMAALTPDELRAVVAHELGHYAGGDTRFSAWIWRTRVAVLRTVIELGGSDSFFRRTIVRAPFLLYAKLFERLTSAVSRQQELAADAMAARAAGAAAAGSALRRVSAADPAYRADWASDLSFLLEKGTRPPIANGFGQFLAEHQIVAQLDEVVAADLQTQEADPYASHPTLKQRLVALGIDPALGAPPLSPEDSSVTLLDDLPSLESELLRIQFGEAATSELQPVDWESASELHADEWDAIAERFGPILAGTTVGSAAEAASDAQRFRADFRRVLGEGARGHDDEAVDDLTRSTIGSLVARALRTNGFEVVAAPGAPLSCHRGDLVIRPYAELQEAVQAGDPEPWHRRSAEAGVENLAL